MSDRQAPTKLYTDIEMSEYVAKMMNHIGTIAESNDPPNPFRKGYEVDKNINLVLNSLNDLKQTLSYYCDIITYNNDWTYIIVCEYKNGGYSTEVLNRIADECSYPTQLFESEDWAVFCINMTIGQKLILDNGILRIK